MPESRNALQRDELWKILVDTVHTLPMYKNHKRYVQDVMLKEKPDISPQELAIQINISIGEALVLLNEIREGENKKQPELAATGKRAESTLLDFSS